jgi:hypothetical protein
MELWTQCKVCCVVGDVYACVVLLCLCFLLFLLVSTVMPAVIEHVCCLTVGPTQQPDPVA